MWKQVRSDDLRNNVLLTEYQRMNRAAIRCSASGVINFKYIVLAEYYNVADIRRRRSGSLLNVVIPLRTRNGGRGSSIGSFLSSVKDELGNKGEIDIGQANFGCSERTPRTSKNTRGQTVEPEKRSATGCVIPRPRVADVPRRGLSAERGSV
jgi:hypothetical protein